MHSWQGDPEGMSDMSLMQRGWQPWWLSSLLYLSKYTSEPYFDNNKIEYGLTMKAVFQLRREMRLLRDGIFLGWLPICMPMISPTLFKINNPFGIWNLVLDYYRVLLCFVYPFNTLSLSYHHIIFTIHQLFLLLLFLLHIVHCFLLIEILLMLLFILVGCDDGKTFLRGSWAWR